MLFQVNLILCGLVLSQAFSLAALGANSGRTHPSGWPLMGLGLALAAYALTPFASGAHSPYLLQATFFFESLIPLAFWFVCDALFDDAYSWKRVHLLGIPALVLSMANARLLPFETPWARSASEGVVLALKIMHLVFIGLGIRAALQGWSSDLVEARLRVRLVAVVLSGLSLGALIVAQYHEVGARGFDQTLPVPVNALVFLILFSANAFFYRHKDLLEPRVPGRSVPCPAPLNPVEGEAPEFPSSPTMAPTISGTSASMPPPLSSSTPDLDAKVRNAMENLKLYKDEGLTIAKLAEALKVPEYRLRAHINGVLGYRNFNQFLAHHRIGLACQMLTSPHHRHEKILSIALEVGFASLAPFNRAFKETTGMTPSDYRQSHSC